MNKVLIVIDAQEDFTRGALRNEEAIKALPVIGEAVRFAHEHDMNMLFTQDRHWEYKYLNSQEGRNLPIPHCIYGTDGHKFCPEVLIDDKVPGRIIPKGRFGYTGFDRYYCYDIKWDDQHKCLNDEIWLCGFCTDICVSANFQILKAQFPEMPIVVIKDACAGVTPELHEAALKVMESCQGKIMTWEELKERSLKK